MASISFIDWQKVNKHYSQYSAEEQQEMCTLNRCQTCKTQRECRTGIEEARMSFLMHVQAHPEQLMAA